MAAGGRAVQELWEELTCPICLDCFRDPVSIGECGHNFCRDCLTRSCGELGAAASCPQCRGTAQPWNLKPNRQLANVVEIAKKLRLQRGKGAGAEELERKGGVCEKHQEPLKLFCREDRGLICVVCDRSKEHRRHDVIPVEEAAQEYKDKLHGSILTWMKEKEKILAHKAVTEKQSQDKLEQTKLAREKSMAEFRKLYQQLEKKEQLQMAQLEKAEKEIARDRDELLAIFSGELSSIEKLIQEMQKKIQQPASELLQDVNSILKWCEKKEETRNSVTPNLEVRWWPWLNVRNIKCFLDSDREQFKAANVTLDPNTAHLQLILSEDQKSVRCEGHSSYLPGDPERFDDRSIVLGCEGFTSGRHFWEVTVEEKGWWAVGVALKSVWRKGCITVSPSRGIWSVGKMRLGYIALSDPEWYCLGLNREIKRIQVILNYDRGQVVFFDADTAASLYKFSGAFHGETLLPFFWVLRNTSLRLS